MESADGIVTAWVAAQQAFDAAARTADPDEPDLAATTLPPMLDTSRTLLGQMRAAGEVAVGPVGYGTPVVISHAGPRATVQSCEHDAEIVVSTATGRPVSGVMGRPEEESFSSTMELTDGGWRLADQTVEVGRCAG